jgi:Recombinase zinc beta ribbon domain
VEQGYMAPEVAARLDPQEHYGIWWYCGKDYDGNQHRVAVPVPDSGIPRDWVDAARKAIEDNVPASNAGDRFWELSGGVLLCGGCGCRMQVHPVKSAKREKVYFYYRCSKLGEVTKKPCPANVRLPAEHVEEVIWQFTTELLTEPEQITDGLDRLIEQERSRLRGDPEVAIRELHGKLEALACRRNAYQDQQAAGYMTLDELGPKLTELEEARNAIERELEACKNRGSRIAELKAMRDFWAMRGELWETLDELREWTAVQHPNETAARYQMRILVAEDYNNHLHRVRDKARKARLSELQNATPEPRRQQYEELELRVTAYSKEEYEVAGVCFDPERFYICATSHSPSTTSTLT